MHSHQIWKAEGRWRLASHHFGLFLSVSEVLENWGFFVADSSVHSAASWLLRGYCGGSGSSSGFLILASWYLDPSYKNESCALNSGVRGRIEAGSPTLEGQFWIVPGILPEAHHDLLLWPSQQCCRTSFPVSNLFLLKVSNLVSVSSIESRHTHIYICLAVLYGH